MQNVERQVPLAKQKHKKIFMRIIGILIPIAFFGVLKVCLGAFGIAWFSTYAQTELFVSEMCILLFMSSALILVLKCGCFIFSLGAICALSPLIAVSVCPNADSIMLLFMSVFFGCLLGLICGGVQIMAKLPPVQCSICMCLIYEGIALIFEKSGRCSILVNSFSGGIKFFIICAVIFEIVFYMLINKTVYGYNLKAISKNRKIAKNFGVNFNLNLLYTYIMSGGIIGAAGYMLAVRQGNSIGMGLNFASVRILFFALFSLFIGKFMSKLIGEMTGYFFGAVCAAMMYSAGRELNFSENMNVIICFTVILFILIYLSNEKNFFFGIHTKNFSKKFKKGIDK